MSPNPTAFQLTFPINASPGIQSKEIPDEEEAEANRSFSAKGTKRARVAAPKWTETVQD